MEPETPIDRDLRALVAGRNCEAEYAQLINDWTQRLVSEYPDQPEVGDPEEYFDLLLEDDLPLDLAAAWVADEVGKAVAINLAVDRCFLDDVPECADSDVDRAWRAFDDQISSAGRTTESVVVDLLDQGFDPYVAVGIGVYQCSPPAGDGCGDQDLFKQVWNDVELSFDLDMTPAEALEDTRELAGDLVAELIGAALCGEATCWAGYEGEITVASENYVRGEVRYAAPSGGQQSAFWRVVCKFARFSDRCR